MLRSGKGVGIIVILWRNDMQETEFQENYTNWLEKQPEVPCGDKRGHHWHTDFLGIDCPMCERYINAYPE